MAKHVCHFALASTFVVVALVSASCSNSADEPASPDFKTQGVAKFPNYSLSDRSDLIPDVTGYLRVTARSADDAAGLPGKALSVSDFNFGKTEVLMSDDKQSDVVAVPSTHTPGSYLVMLREGDYIKSLCLMDYVFDSPTQASVTFRTDTGEVLFECTYSANDNTLRLKDVSQDLNSTLLRSASSAAWGCGLSLGAVGGMWATVVGMACPVAGFAVGMAYTAFSIWACGEL